MEQRPEAPADRECSGVGGRFYDEPPPLNVSLFVWLLSQCSQELYQAELLGKGKN